MARVRRSPRAREPEPESDDSESESDSESGSPRGSDHSGWPGPGHRPVTFGARWLPPPAGAGSQFLKNKQSTHTATGMITDSDDDPSRPRSDSKPESESADRSRTADSDGLGYFRLGLGVKPEPCFQHELRVMKPKIQAGKDCY